MSLNRASTWLFTVPNTFWRIGSVGSFTGNMWMFASPPTPIMQAGSTSEMWKSALSFGVTVASAPMSPMRSTLTLSAGTIVAWRSPSPDMPGLLT